MAQADHNREVARYLATPPRHDWAITAAFYSAVHYFEAWLFDEAEKHSETSIPTNSDGKLAHTAHGWREILVHRKMPKDAFISFRKLHETSETARYLSLFKVGTPAAPTWTTAPAPNYFNEAHARSLVEGDLEKFRRVVKAELRGFLQKLDLEGRSPIAGRLLRKKVLQFFRDSAELLNQSEGDLRGRFGTPEVALLKAALADSGLALRRTDGD